MSAASIKAYCLPVISPGRRGCPCRRTSSSRSGRLPPQASLTASQRRENLKGAFSVRDPEALKGKRVLLVDDVFTTGSTIGEASKALLQAGVGEVLAVTVARSL